MPLSTASNEQATQTLAVGISRLYDANVKSVIFRNGKLFGIYPQQPSRGDLAYRWPVHTAGNASAESFVAGQALPESGNQTYTYADLAYSTGYYRVVIAVDGHMRDALRSEADVFGVASQEMQRGQADMLDLLHTACLGTGAMGLQLAIDSTGTYAAIARGTIAAWGSEENAIAGAALAVTDLDLMYQELTDAERGCNPTLILASPTAWRIVRQLAGQVGGPTIQQTAVGGGPVNLDLGINPGGLSYNGIPIVTMPDLTATVLLWQDVPLSDSAFIVHRPIEVNPIGRRQDAQEFDVSYALLLKVGNPQKCGKITGVA